MLFFWTTATLGVDDLVNETLWITVELEITSQAAKFFNQVLSFLSYGGSSVMQTLNEISFHMKRMV